MAKQILRAILVCVVVCAGAWTPAPALAQPAASDAEREQLLGVVAGAAARTPRGGARDDLLSGLRLLRDPALRPLFERLAASDSASLRLHGALGAAEIDPERGLDVTALKKLGTAQEQAAAFSQAARLDLVGARQAREVLAWEGAPAELTVLAIGRLIRAGEQVDGAALRALAEDDNLAVAVMAALQLLELGNAGGTAAQAFDRFFEMPEEKRRATVGLLLQYVRRENLSGAGPFVARVLETIDEDDALMRIEAVHTMLKLAPESGAPLWAEAYRRADGLGMKLLVGLAALDVAERAPRAMFDPMIADESSELVRLMGRAGAAVASGGDAAGAIEALVGQAHAPTCLWALERARSMAPEPAARALRAVIGAAAAHGRARPDLQAAALPAAAELAERAPRALSGALDEACAQGDDGLCQFLLAGALRAKGIDSAAPFLSGGREWPGEGSEAMSALVEARYTPKPTPAQAERLRRIALGWGGLSNLFRVQAAWMALRAEGREKEAIDRMVKG